MESDVFVLPVLSADEKWALFLKLYPFESPPARDAVRWCLHCQMQIRVERWQLVPLPFAEGRFLIGCPNAPECDGTVIDWMDSDGKEESCVD